MKMEAFDGDVLKTKRKKSLLTREKFIDELSVKCKITVSRSALYYMESCRMVPTVNVLYYIARYFNCQMEAFFTESAYYKLNNKTE